MIQSIRVRDFQRHAFLKLKLDSITTIVGPSDVGKSAILRALRWVMLNQPRGGSFIRRGKKKVSVSIRAEKKKITRSKGTENFYSLDRDRFTAFGNDVPQEIASFLRVSPLNFQGQHDRPFWFSETPSFVSKELNKLVDLGEIDKVLANLSSSLRRTKAEQGVVKDRLRAAVRERNKLQWASRADRALRRIEKLRDRHEEIQRKRKSLSRLLQEIGKAEKAQERFSSLNRIAQDLSRLEGARERLQEIREQRERLESWEKEFLTLADNQASDLADLCEAEDELATLMRKKCPLCGSVVRSSTRAK